MTTTTDLPDLNNINHIIRHLWNGREYGNAAVMVGAGFSRNAEKITPTASSFPTWNDLGEKMYLHLYPQGQQDDIAYKQNMIRTISGGGVIKLALEYEKALSRSSLDNLLRSEIPDLHYKPGRLHELLLNLPWSDIFTTNYDTLLERTNLVDINYCLVETVEDIPESQKPRIVKLHGSFQSHRPFIITEEDYRTYPVEYAPFVNLVRQSIMENILCLVGFSSDDPNFLQWIGWVRDNLKNSALYVYLIGVLSLSPSKRRVLESLNIIPVDLLPLFPEKLFPDEDERHKLALDWFFTTLKQNAPPDPMKWPNYSVIQQPNIHPNYPVIPKGPFPLYQPCSMDIQVEFNSDIDVIDLIERWRSLRKNYPGWIVCPSNIREVLWEYTKRLVTKLLFTFKNLTPPNDLFLLYELNWRFQTVLMPIPKEMAESMFNIIKKYHPFPTENTVFDDNIISPTIDKYKDLPWDRIRNYWINLNISLARKARQIHSYDSFLSIIGSIKDIILKNMEWKSRLYYEFCLYNISRFDMESLQATIAEWPSTPEYPWGEIQKACILSEWGEIEHAELIAENALNIIRSKARFPYKDYSYLSQESWAMFLVKIIKLQKYGSLYMRNHEKGQTLIREYNKRWEKLRAFRCNPWDETELLGSVLNGAPPKQQPTSSTKAGFLPGQISDIFQFTTDPYIYKLLPAYSFLMMLEDGAIPLRCGNVQVSKDIVNAAKWIEPVDYFWSITSFIRWNPKDEIETWFDRATVATLPDECINYYQTILLSWMKQIVGTNDVQRSNLLQNNPMSIRLLQPVMNIISRTSMRFDNDNIEIAFTLAMGIYKKAINHIIISTEDTIRLFLIHLFYSLPTSLIDKYINELLTLPMPKHTNAPSSVFENWFDPFEYLPTRQYEDKHIFNKDEINDSLNKLIDFVKTGTKEDRKRATQRLYFVYYVGGMTDEQEKSFGQALWSQIDSTSGFPANTNIHKFLFLILPECIDGNALRAFKNYIANTSFNNLIQKSVDCDGRESSTYSDRTDNNEYARDIVRSTIPIIPSLLNSPLRKLIDWTEAEALQIFNKAKAWWQKEKDNLNNEPIIDIGIPSVTHDLKEGIDLFIEILGSVVFPRILNADRMTKQDAMKIITEMSDMNVIVCTILPQTLFLQKNMKKSVEDRIRIALFSFNRNVVRGAIIGIFNWIAYSVNKGLPSPPVRLIEDFINKITTRRNPALSEALRFAAIIINEFPNILKPTQITSLCTSLEFLREESKLPTYFDIQRLDNWEKERVYDNNSDFTLNELMECRRRSAMLAFSIYRYYRKNGKDVPKIINVWEEICKNDPLPEVRYEWKANEI